MTKEKLMKQSKEQLVIWLMKSEERRLQLHERLEKLTGCNEFGMCDSTNGFCIKCYYNKPELWEKCHNFKFDKK